MECEVDQVISLHSFFRGTYCIDGATATALCSIPRRSTSLCLRYWAASPLPRFFKPKHQIYIRISFTGHNLHLGEAGGGAVPKFHAKSFHAIRLAAPLFKRAVACARQVGCCGLALSRCLPRVAQCLSFRRAPTSSLRRHRLLRRRQAPQWSVSICPSGRVTLH
jgi:hypothetical protein